jgi:hypothetical protein
MPSPDTFSIPPIAVLLGQWLAGRAVVVDPFARNATWGTLTNDLNSDTMAASHEAADLWCAGLADSGIVADAVLFDPPYSPRQIAEVYQAIGRSCSTADTQSGALYRRVRDELDRTLRLGGIAISCGWNSVGFGPAYVIEEILLVCHGGPHNDTIVMVERKQQGTLI